MDYIINYAAIKCLVEVGKGYMCCIIFVINLCLQVFMIVSEQITVF